jgi:hypothetical protein
MRTGLLSDLATVGYEIFLDGDNVKLRYQKLDNPPDMVRPLIDELRKCKAEVVNILKADNNITSAENKQTKASVQTSWTPEIQPLIDWFVEMEPPVAPFDLEPHRKVIDPEKFFTSLRQEIEVGARYPRNRNGALLFDLKILNNILH